MATDTKATLNNVRQVCRERYGTMWWDCPKHVKKERKTEAKRLLKEMWMVRTHGFEEAATKIQRKWRSSDPERLMREFNRMKDELAAAKAQLAPPPKKN